MKALVIGSGRVGAGLTRILVQRGHSVVVIDRNPEAFDRLRNVGNIRMLQGIGFDRETLLEAGIRHADALAAVTSSDEVNIVTAQVARQVFGVPKVVARVFEARYGDIYRRLGLQTVAPNAWGIERIADLLSHRPLETVAEFGNGEIRVVAAEIPRLMIHRAVSQLATAGEIAVIAIQRSNTCFLPTPETIFEEGDIVFMAATPAPAERLSRLFETH